MSTNRSTILKIARRISVVFVLATCAVSSFAVLGDKGKTPRSNSLLTNQNFTITRGSFSLKSNYNFRGSQLINPEQSNEYINLNTVVTYQKGNSTYIVPLKKKIFITTQRAGFTINH